MAYLLLFFLVIIGVGKVIALFNPSAEKTIGERNKKVNYPVNQKNWKNDSDTEIHYHNLQVARSQHNKPAEQFFLMGLMDSASRQENMQDSVDDEDYENYEDGGEYQDDDIRDEYGE